MKECSTRYPLLLVHGMGFRDGRIGYWGRIPRVLREKGARVFFGGQEANASIQRNALLLAERLRRVLRETGAEKVNIIAHSKGGLEARWLISVLGMGGSVASLTTISTPHQGSAVMEKLMRLPEPLMKLIGRTTDVFKRLGGDEQPDTFACFRQLTKGYMKEFNRLCPDDGRVLYRSCAFTMKSPLSDILMAVPFAAVKAMNGQSDGFLVPEEVRWGQFMGTFTGTGLRGISHCDEVDLRRRRLCRRAPGKPSELSDITRLYVSLVSGLRELGL
ncbi:MAG: hypothetical protein IJ071_02380 [Ruminococcus sp.]|nr:hypothetical protein [Ruminococcus sp.]